MLFKCKMCGGDLEVLAGTAVAECIYCGTKQTVPQSMDENLKNLFNRANLLRIKGEFDKAEAIYEKIVQADSTQSEAYWGLILCRYGIEYVDDPVTFQKIPTCHRASYDSVIADEDYKAALANADPSRRAIYEQQAAEIDRIQREILALAQRQETYDVFICYKETDAEGHRTQDSVLANEIYYQLTQEGFKVFYAAITLEGKLGEAYEPIIFAALNSAKVMLAIGTKPEYFNAVWVRNEWSRYLKIMQKDRSKLLIPCYREMDPYELPEEFAHLQAQDMAKLGFINDLVRGVKKVMGKDAAAQTAVRAESSAANGAVNIAPLLKRIHLFLEDGDWERADEFCEQVLNQDPECAEAYLCKLMAELRVHNQEELRDCKEPFDGSNNYQKTFRFGDKALKTMLVECVTHIVKRNEAALQEQTYKDACSAMQNASTEAEIRHVAQLFGRLGSYKDSEARRQDCYERAELLHKDNVLKRGISEMKYQTVEGYEDAIALFESVAGWKNADQLAQECREKVEKTRIEAARKAKRARIIGLVSAVAIAVLVLVVIMLSSVLKYNEAVALMEDGKYDSAIALFQELNDQEMIEECRAAATYDEAISYLESEKYQEAIAAFETIIDYRDSEEKIEETEQKIEQKIADSLKDPKVGEIVYFGNYEQDNDTSNGAEMIEWKVLEVKDGKALVLSKNALDCQPYNTSLTVVTWETCSLRSWLNSSFMDVAFSADEKAMIPTVTVSADENPEYSTDPGNATQDQVFLLSITEANKYFSSDSARQCEPTDYAVANGADVYNDNCLWWLRSPGYIQDDAAFVDTDGDVYEFGCYGDDDDLAVRPALWIELG